MVMKRFFRITRGGGGGVKRRGGAAEASKDSSRDDTFDTSCDSQRNCLPQHVGKPGGENDLNQDDVSSILLGESVGSPNNSFRNNNNINNNKRNKENSNNNNDTSKYDKNVSFVVRSTLETLRIVADVEFDQEGGMLQPDGTTLDVLRGGVLGHEMPLSWGRRRNSYEPRLLLPVPTRTSGVHW
jgi:hypothetical protein